jgi:hypothetical protein
VSVEILLGDRIEIAARAAGSGGVELRNPGFQM